MTNIDDEGFFGDSHLNAKTVIWTAGVADSSAGKWLNVKVDRAGRVKVQDVVPTTLPIVQEAQTASEKELV